MKKYKLLLFDLDDTLLHSDWFKQGLIQTIEEHPLTKNIDAALFLEKKLRVPSHMIDKLKNREFTPDEFRRARWQHAFSHFDINPDDEALTEIENLFLQKGLSCINKDPSLISLLEDLRNHYELGIVTNALYDPRQKIYHMGLSEVFPDKTIFSAEELGFRKPDREFYHAPLTYFEVNPEDTMFIGDSWIHDVAGAMDAGMSAIWINSRGAVPATGHSPYAVVSDVKDIRDLLLNDYNNTIWEDLSMNSTKSIVDKLNLTKYTNRLILNLPEDIDEFKEFDYDAAIQQEKYDLIFAFVFNLEEFSNELNNVIEKQLLSEKGYLFFAYPKKNNPQYKEYIERDQIFPYIKVGEDGYVAESNLKFSRMVSLNDVFTVVGLRSEKKKAASSSKKSQCVDDYIVHVDDIKTYLEKNAELLSAYNALTFGYQKDWARYVYSAKRKETQEKRLLEMEDILGKGYKSIDLYRRRSMK